MNMLCRLHRWRIDWSLDDRGTPPPRTMSHLQSCPGCRSYFEEQAEVVRLLGQPVAVPEASEELRAAVLAELGEDTRAEVSRPPLVRPHGGRTRLVIQVTAAVAFVTVILFWNRFDNDRFRWWKSTSSPRGTVEPIPPAAPDPVPDRIPDSPPQVAVSPVDPAGQFDVRVVSRWLSETLTPPPASEPGPVESDRRSGARFGTQIVLLGWDDALADRYKNAEKMNQDYELIGSFVERVRQRIGL